MGQPKKATYKEKVLKRNDAEALKLLKKSLEDHTGLGSHRTVMAEVTKVIMNSRSDDKTVDLAIQQLNGCIKAVRAVRTAMASKTLSQVILLELESIQHDAIYLMCEARVRRNAVF